MVAVTKYEAFAELSFPKDIARRHDLFQLQPTQVAAKEVVKFAPSQTLVRALAEADRKLAAGESLLPQLAGSATVFRCA